jgi:mRNA interferase RelE/StbE
MGSYSVRWKHSAAKELRGLDRDVIARILRTVDELAHDPCPSGSRKLRGSDRTYRLRVGDYRIVYPCRADDHDALNQVQVVSGPATLPKIDFQASGAT